MLHVGRSGSGVVGKLLHQNPAVFWDGEVLKREGRGQELRAADGATRDAIARMGEKLREANRPVYGFELKPFHVEELGRELGAFVDGLRSCAFSRFIVLERENLLRKVVSSRVAHETAQWHLAAGAEPRLHRIVLDVDEVRIDNTRLSLLATLEKLSGLFPTLAALLVDDPVLRLTYEDDVRQDPRAAYARICDFLGVEHVAVDVPYVRTNPFPLPDVVRNFEDVRRVLVGTPFEWMLDD